MGPRSRKTRWHGTRSAGGHDGTRSSALAGLSSFSALGLWVALACGGCGGSEAASAGDDNGGDLTQASTSAPFVHPGVLVDKGESSAEAIVGVVEEALSAWLACRDGVARAMGLVRAG